jgi:hypothetical protein
VSLSRRRAVLHVGAFCALAPSLSGRALAHIAGGEVFAPPSAPMIYTRRLVRELRGGLHLTVARSFQVRFIARPDGGYELTGVQARVEVAAPEKMAPFAEMERSRIETGVFPLQLCSRGLIERGPGFASSDLLDHAVAEARRQLAALPANERIEAEAFVQSVHRAADGVAAHLPEDVFAPTQHSRSERRVLEVPGGEPGEIEVRFTGDADPLTGLMNRARREIVTLIGGDRRATAEEWALRAA